MKKLLLAGCLALLLVGAVVTVAPARNGNGNGNGKKSVTAKLEGFQEVPSISTKARGEIKVKVNGSSIRYELKYRGFDARQRRAVRAHPLRPGGCERRRGGVPVRWRRQAGVPAGLRRP